MPEDGPETMEGSDVAVIDPLPADVRADLAPLAEQIRSRQASAVQSVIEIGELLAAAREKLAKHKTGIFCKWVESECGMTYRSGVRCMQSFERWGNCDTVSQFEPTALYLLSAPSCPEEAQNEAEKLADAGESVTTKVARDLVDKHRPPKEPDPMTAMEVIDAIRKAIRVVFENCPADIRPIVAPKFRDFANELERTGDLSW